MTEMIKRMTVSIAAAIACVVMFAVVPASAQVSPAPTWQDIPGKYHQRLSQILTDMTHQMGQMTEQMSRSDLPSDQRQQMAQRMARMSTMMQRISGLVARPALKEADWQEQMDQMRKQMDEMMRDSQMAPGAK